MMGYFPCRSRGAISFLQLLNSKANGIKKRQHTFTSSDIQFEWPIEVVFWTTFNISKKLVPSVRTKSNQVTWTRDNPTSRYKDQRTLSKWTLRNNSSTLVLCWWHNSKIPTNTFSSNSSTNFRDIKLKVTDRVCNLEGTRGSATTWRCITSSFCTYSSNWWGRKCLLRKIKSRAAILLLKGSLLRIYLGKKERASGDQGESPRTSKLNSHWLKTSQQYHFQSSSSYSQIVTLKMEAQSTMYKTTWTWI